MPEIETLVGKTIWLDVGDDNMSKVYIESFDECKVFCIFINEKIDHSFGILQMDVFKKGFISIIDDYSYCPN